MSDYVTRDELAAHLDPMHRDIAEIKADVKTLLGADAGETAVQRFRREQRGGLISWGAILFAGLSATFNFIHPH